MKALAKVHEQRELIDQNQLAGSSYRPNRRDAGEVALKQSKFFGSPPRELDWLPGKTKAGRVLAQRNVDRLNDVHDNLIELEKMSDLQPKAAKVMAKDCRQTVKAIMDECSTPEADVPEDKGQSSAQSAAKLLGQISGDPVVLKRFHDATGAMLEVQKSDKLVAQYRKAINKKTPAPQNGSAGKR